MAFSFSSSASRARLWAWPALAYVAVVAALWPIPVFGVLHAESSAVVAAAAYFVSAVAAVGALRGGERAGRVVARSVALLAVPLAGLTLSLLWRPNCAYLTGLGLFGVLVPPSAVLGVGVAAALVSMGVRRARLVAVALGVAWAAFGTLWDLGRHPQLFVYNAVFGGVLGPIYDAELSVRAGLFVARGEALVAAGALLALARWRKGRKRKEAVIAISGSIVLALTAAFSVQLGVHQSAVGIERALSQRVVDGRVVVHVSPETRPAEAGRLAADAAFRLDQVEARLGVRASAPVDVYLYPDPETKGDLIGSRETSVTPTWLPTPQVHMLASEVGRSLGHEMAHVVAREFGAPLIRASPSVGLVEGLAVAVEPPDGLPGAEALVAAGLTLPGDAGGLTESPARVVEQAMNPLGFWSGRAAVSYSATGAFVAWLMETRGVPAVREAYRTGDVAGATGASVASLAEAWAKHIRAVPAPAEARATAAYLFRQPSLFEVPCPHFVPAYVRDTRAGYEALDAGDAAAAAETFGRALDARPDFAPALAGWVAASPTDLEPRLGVVFAAARDTAALALTLRVAADAARLTGRNRLAATFYARAWARLAPTDRGGRLELRLRSRLDARTLGALFATPSSPARTAAALSASPFHAALFWDDAGEAIRAWAVVQRVSPAGLPADERGALRLVAARLAYHARAVAASGRLAAVAERDLRASGAEALAGVAADWRARVRWRLARDRAATMP